MASSSAFLRSVASRLAALPIDGTTSVKGFAGDDPRLELTHRTVAPTSGVAVKAALRAVFPLAQIHHASSGPGSWPATTVTRVVFSLPPDAGVA